MSQKVKYSELRKKLKISDDNVKQSSDLAGITHFLQNLDEDAGSYYRSDAAAYFETLGIEDRDPSVQYRLPIHWDVPFPPPQNPKFKFIDLFAGIGGFRLAFQNLGGKCVFTSEWNEFSQKTYEANFGEVPYGDITKIDENKIPDHDILLAGFS